MDATGGLRRSRHRRRRPPPGATWRAALLALAVWCALPGAAAAQQFDPSMPLNFTADEVRHDRVLGVVTASGSVQVVQGERILNADTISYNQRRDYLSASGNISLLEPSGEVIFADFMEITGDLKDGTIANIRMILADGARLAANGGRRTDGNKTTFSKAVYSPCNLCADGKNRAPLWQVKAVKVTHDQERQTVEYRDAWLEVAGVPVAYTPYLSHPDPTVKRRSGLLAPTFGGSSDLGLTAWVPYYFAISPHNDATLTPFYSAKEGPGIVGEYRHRFQDGELAATASFTVDSTDDIRGHIDSEGRFDINSTWRWGYDLKRATDDTYQRRYGFYSEETLTSRLYAEGFRRRNYFEASAYSFQGLEVNDDPGETPLVLPMLSYSHVGEADRWGGRTELDLNLLSMTRSDGRDTRRLSMDAAWRKPFYTDFGSAFEVAANLRGDVYHTNGLVRPNRPGTWTGFSGRLVPEASIDWRHPFIRTEKDGRIYQIVEPIAAVIASPYGGNPQTIPNEDSIDFALDETNLFSDNRFPGLDRIEGGPRVNYGLKWSIHGAGGGSTSAFLGQSYRFKEDDTFAEGSGLEQKFSDLVGVVGISPDDHLHLFYRTRLDKENFTPNRNEVQLNAGVPLLRVSANYVYFEPARGSEFSGREEISYAVSSQMNRYWRAQVFGTRDLTAGGGQRLFGGRLIYEDECLTLALVARRTFFQDRDLQPNDSVTLRVEFKTLGEVSSGLF
ncbi:MAG: LPS-assembly protein LptD [Hyphomicrobiales bacterium]|nr:LPS-assembly protein LptD [Hyphomicrobiales bacterium]MCP5373862.1 LPS-assembly protein LptD [Hyphomicrobiales bacterium]